MALIPGSGRPPSRREGQPTPVFLPGEFHGQRSLAGYSPWGCKESDMTEWLILSLHGNSIFNFFFEEPPILFSIVAASIYIRTNRAQLLHILTNTCCFLFPWTIALVMCVMWHLVVAFTCISLTTSDVKHLFVCALYRFHLREVLRVTHAEGPAGRSWATVRRLNLPLREAGAGV